MNPIDAVDPLSLNYLRQIRAIMTLVGAWPDAALACTPRRTRFYSLYLTLQTTLLFSGEAFFTITLFHELSFFILGDVSIALVLTLVVLMRCVLPLLPRYGDIFQEWIRKFHLQHFKHKSEYSAKICDSVDLISYYFTMFTTVMTVVTGVFYNIMPFYHNWQNGVFRADRPHNVTMDFSVHYAYPGFRQEDHFVLSSLANIYISYVAAFSVCFVDGCLCLMVFQIIGHIKILAHTIRTFPKPRLAKPQKHRWRDGEMFIIVEVTKDFDEQENAVIAKLITDCVKYHLFIISFTETISSFFGPMLALNYLYDFVSLSLLLVECMQGTEATLRFGLLTVLTLGQLIQLSVIFEVVGSESEKLQDEIYCVPWEAMSVSNQRSVLMMLRRMQTPIHVTAMGMTEVGVRTMASILRTTLSYCAILNSIPDG